MAKKVGVELEFLLRKEDGTPIRAYNTIKIDPRNMQNGVPLMTGEVTPACAEIQTKPAATVHELAQNLLSRLEAAERLAAEHGAIIVPTSEYGTSSEPIDLGDHHRRFPVYQAVIANPRLVQAFASVLGTHIHLDQDREKPIRQYNLMLGMDPLLRALGATTPLSFQAKNGINSYRGLFTRGEGFFRKVPLFVELQPYVASREELREQYRQGREQFFARARSLGFTQSDLERRFPEHKTGFYPVREKKQIGTWEARGPDAGPPDVVLAGVALLKGLDAYMTSRDITLRTNGDWYEFTPGKIVLPRHEVLLEADKRGITYGLRDTDLANALYDAISLAQRGLPTQDHRYLEPAREMAVSGMNRASQLSNYIHQRHGAGPEYNPAQAADATLHMRKMYEEARDRCAA